MMSWVSSSERLRSARATSRRTAMEGSLARAAACSSSLCSTKRRARKAAIRICASSWLSIFSTSAMPLSPSWASSQTARAWMYSLGSSSRAFTAGSDFSPAAFSRVKPASRTLLAGLFSEAIWPASVLISYFAGRGLSPLRLMR